MIALYICLSLVTVRRVAGGCQLVPPTNTDSEQIGHITNMQRKYLQKIFRHGVKYDVQAWCLSRARPSPARGTCP